jgi:phenylpropionate dioxygenase-like ring-hydroxylating dioxygenase large terminal subunit
MAYIGANEVAAIRKELKAQFPEFKFGVRKGTGSLSVGVTVKSGPTDFSDIFHNVGHGQINHHWLCNYGKHQAFFEQIMRIVKIAPATVPGGRRWFDESDAMTDYFHTAFYIHLDVGSWDKDYVCVAK